MSRKMELAKIAKEIKAIKAMLVTGFDRGFAKKVEDLTNSKFVKVDKNVYYFDICDTCELFEIEVVEEADGEKTWVIGDQEYFDEKDFLKSVGKVADQYRKYR